MHIDADRLEAHLDGAPLTTAERVHLDGCPRCAGDLADARAVHDLLRAHAAAAPAPPPSLQLSASMRLDSAQVRELSATFWRVDGGPLEAFRYGQAPTDPDAGELLGVLTVGATRLAYQSPDETLASIPTPTFPSRSGYVSAQFHPRQSASRIIVSAGEDLLLMLALHDDVLTLGGRDRLSGAAVPLEASLRVPPADAVTAASSGDQAIALPRPTRRGRLDIIDAGQRWMLQIAAAEPQDD